MNNDGNSLDYIYNNFLNLMTLRGFPHPQRNVRVDKRS